MPIVIQCSGCQRRFRAPDKAAGKRVQCPKCSTVFQVPIAGHPQPASAPDELHDSKIPDPAAVQKAIELLVSAGPDSEKECVVRDIRRLGAHATAVTQMIEQLKDDDYQQRQTAARALGHLGDPRAVDPLISALDKEYRGASKPGPVFRMGTAVSDMNEYVRRAMVTALRRLSDSRALDVLKRAANDSELSVRKEATAAIREIESGDELRKRTPQRDRIQVLVQEVKNGDSPTRRKASEAIKKAIEQLLVAEPTASENGVLESLLSPLVYYSATLEFCTCGYPTKEVHSDGSWGPFLQLVDCKLDGDDWQHYTCPKCGSHIKTLASP